MLPIIPFMLCVLLTGLSVHAVEDARPVEQASVKLPPSGANPKLPTLFLVGDSTVKVGTKGQRGWGDEIAPFFDTNKINIVNRAIGGRSSRTFQTEGRWDLVLAEMKSGDFMIVQFGHNDGGELFKGDRPRASLRGNGEETQEGTVEATGKKEVVHTFGWYLRKYAADAKAKGVTPIICSLIPRKIYGKDDKISRASESHGKWAAEAAKASGTAFVDLNEIIARKYDELGKTNVNALFADAHTHTTVAGAQLNAQCVVAGVRALPKAPLDPFLSSRGLDVKPQP
jgi:lysophospholipase L1-like esterase